MKFLRAFFVKKIANIFIKSIGITMMTTYSRRSTLATRRPPRRRTRRVVRRKAPASKRVRTLERRVNTLAKAKVWGTYKLTGSTNVTAPYYHLRLIDVSQWATAFANSDLVENVSQFNLTSVNLNLSIVPNSENGMIDFTVFVCSPRRENARKVIFETAGGSALVAGRDYIQDSYGTGTLMNQERWKVHRVKKCFTRIEFGTQEPAAPTPTRKIHMKMPWRVPFKSATGNWRADFLNREDVNAVSHLQLFVFNNNSGLNLAYPSVYHNILYTGHAVS